MKSGSDKDIEKTGISLLPVTRNFRKVIESRDMSFMNKELYQFLNLYCGFIAHYNIHGFRETYASPRDFADVFIRHFDQGHRYYCGNYACHYEPYQNTGFSKAEIKQEFLQIVDKHKDAIARWADGVEKDRRYSLFKALKSEFEPEDQNVLTKFRQDIAIKQSGGEKHVEYTI